MSESGEKTVLVVGLWGQHRHSLPLTLVDAVVVGECDGWEQEKSR